MEHVFNQQKLFHDTILIIHLGIIKKSIICVDDRDWIKGKF